LSTVDVVTVSYNSAGQLRRCVDAALRLQDMTMIVVDNASSDGSLETIADRDVVAIPLRRNVGFAAGCNVGWRRGRSPYVLFLNPDAVIDGDSIDRLVTVLEDDLSAGAVAPKIRNEDGSLAYSLRRFPRVSSNFAQALFLHRVFPRLPWTDELIRDPRCYERRWTPEWVSGACLMVRRSVLEELGGWDERFFLFGEDVDLCKRIGDAGHTLWFEPCAECVHMGGASSVKQAVLPLLTEGRIRYVEIHHGRLRATVERMGYGLGALTRVVAGGRAARRGHIRSLLVAMWILRVDP
jgi:GT2 family glycosyltransferase